MTAPPVRAALRDASFYKKPGWSGKYHVLIDHERESGVAACSPPRPAPLGAEGSFWPRMVLLLDTIQPAAAVPDFQRCGRPGCRGRWPAPPVPCGTVEP